MENKKNVIQLMSQRKALPPDELRNMKLYVCVCSRKGGTLLLSYLSKGADENNNFKRKKKKE